MNCGFLCRFMTIGLWLVGLSGVFVPGVDARGADSLIVHLSVKDASGHSRVIALGLHSEATPGFDRALGEMPLPPFPPIEAFDVRLAVPDPRSLYSGDGSYRDLRPWTTSASADTFIVRLQSAPQSYPIMITWDSEEIGGFGSAVARAQPDPHSLKQDMRASSVCRIPDAEIAGLKIIVRKPRVQEVPHVKETTQ